jgi:hypothetical protein
MKKSSKKKKPAKKSSAKKSSRASRLQKATAAYFFSLSGEALEEENRIGAAMAHATAQVNFDSDY